ncbi:MAG: FliH/SctL family protein [Planctomycetota bacterium]
MAQDSGRRTRPEAFSPGTPVPFQFDDIQALARQLLARANEQAQRVLGAARQEAKEIESAAQKEGRDHGYREGFAQGEAEGRAEGERAAREEIMSQTQTLASTLEALLSELSEERLELRNGAEIDLVALALAVARRVVKRAIRLDGAVVLENVRAAIDLTVDRRDVTLRVNPADLAAVEAHLPELHRAFHDLARVSLQADEDVERGGVRSSTREGEVDLRIAEQIRAIERALLGDEEGEDVAGPFGGAGPVATAAGADENASRDRGAEDAPVQGETLPGDPAGGASSADEPAPGAGGPPEGTSA